MKAIILAAGLGNRMKPLTYNKHKTLLDVAGISILDNIVGSLLKLKVEDICLVLGYKKEQVIDYLQKKYPGVKFQFIINEDYSTTNNIFSLSLAFQNIQLDSDLILIESDLFFDINVLKRLINHPEGNVALVDKYASGMDGTVVKLADDNSIIEVIPPHLQGSNFDFSDKYKTLNIYKFDKDFCNQVFSKLLTYYATVIDQNCYYELILGILIYMQREKIFAEVVSDLKWTEVDDVNDLRIAEFVFNTEKKRDILEDAWGGYWNYNIIDFCFIRNMYFPPNSIVAEIRNNLPNLLHNYGSKNSIVNKKLNNFLLHTEERVIALNGASQIYPFLQTKYGEKTVLMPQPTFGEYGRIFKNKMYYSDAPGFDVNEILIKANDADVVVFVNPNNPTGSLIKSQFIFDFAKKHSSKYILVDESFLDFSSESSIIDLLEKEPLSNILVIKSMSKVFGVPGIRIGFVYSCNDGEMADIRNSLPIWNFNSVAEFFLEVLLKNRNSFAASISKTIKDREDFAEKFSECTWVNKVHQSEANFLLIELTELINEEELIKWLLTRHNIYLKSVSEKFGSAKSYLRVAVRSPQDNFILIEKINEFVKQSKFAIKEYN
jgi:histidinol-phosphate/aromatic aminotransferase/cobyric acid decarboxylase-like protein/choline kinase